MKKEGWSVRKSRMLSELTVPGGKDISEHSFSIFNPNTRDQKLGGFVCLRFFVWFFFFLDFVIFVQILLVEHP